ncbi:transcriptional regulator [Thermocladium modestius]|uniref:Transcriptional regulator n=1 Tax=Thermocladium modestius TaxID=62609 RepID=A0A830GUM0_9CREN|nr:winged helix-turn-helix domain-containing protein [Thermocladium modestius]GGP20992.1 transcriptional regulator [Thermocladium modestius]
MDDINELMKLLSNKALNSSVRLGILLALYYVGGYITFSDIRSSLDMPKSSLHKHLTILKEEGLIEHRRAITPLGIRTVIKLTDRGEAIVEKYIRLIGQLDSSDKDQLD